MNTISDKTTASSRQQPEPTSPLAYTPWPAADVERYLKAGVWQDKTLYQYFLASAQRYPERYAIVSPARIRYRELHQQVHAFAEQLSARGIAAHDTVVLQLPNCPAFVHALLACFALGAVPVMALPAHRKQELNYLLQASHAKGFIAVVNAEGGIGGFAGLNDIHWQGEIIALESAEIIPVVDDKDAPIGRQSDNEQTTSRAEQIALLQLSGGTTGLPKLIPRSHRDYAYSVLASNDICQVTEQSVFLCLLPAAHNFTLSSPGILGVLFAGGALVMADQLSAEQAFTAITRFAISHVALVPPLALNWLNYHRLCRPTGPQTPNAKPLSALTSFLVGGAKLNPSSAQALIEELGAPLQQVFGMAEGLVNYTRLNDSLEIRCHSQGKPISPLDEIRIVDDHDQPVATGETGHLLTKGPYTLRGYLNAEAHNQKAFTPDGFYRTGDLVAMDANGYLTVEGRDKDQINRGGEKISAAELENYLLSHPDITDVAVIAIADEFLGERIGAFIVPTANKTVHLSECRQFLRSLDIAPFKFPDKVICLTELPKTPFGKTSKKTLREMANAKSTTELAV